MISGLSGEPPRKSLSKTASTRSNNICARSVENAAKVATEAGLSSKQKDRPKAVSRRSDDADQAERIALFFRRNAMKPSPQKPRSIIAQVEGSGTAAVKVNVPTPNATSLPSSP